MKILRSLFPFLYRKQKKNEVNKQEQVPESGYEVLLDGKRLSIEDNLLSVSEEYEPLKKSTLYRAFKKSNSYRKGSFEVRKV